MMTLKTPVLPQGLQPVHRLANRLDSRPKILHVITKLDVGGAELTLARLARAQQRSDALDPVIVSLAPAGRVEEDLRRDGLRVETLGMTPGRPGPMGLIRLAALIRALRPKVIQSWLYHANLAVIIALSLTGRLRTVPLYWGIRCSDRDLTHRRLLRAVVRACAALSGIPDAVVVNSDAVLRHHVMLGYRHDRLVVIPNGIDTETFAPRPWLRDEVRRELGMDGNAFLVAHVARADPEKDHEMFLEAMASLPDACAILIGRGTRALPLRSKNVLALGERDDIPRLLAACDVLASSSRRGEGYSNAIAEAMACGLPVVATVNGDARELVGDTGFLTPPGDPEAFADALRTLRRLPVEARARLGQSACERIRAHWSMPRMVDRFAALYRA